MDLTFRELECPNHKGTKMLPHGGRLGGRINSVNMKCPECGLVLLIILMEKDLQYFISAKTTEELIEDRIKAETEKSNIELSKTIDEIRKQYQ